MPDDAASFAPDAHPCLRWKSRSRFRDRHAAKGDVSHNLTKPIRTDEKRSAFRRIKPAPVHAHTKTILAAVDGSWRQFQLCALRADSDTN